MNKLYLLVALGLSVNGQTTSSVTGTSESSNGWYAGDCLISSDFSSSYGYVDFNCGSTCSFSTNTMSCTNYYSAYCADTDYSC